VEVGHVEQAACLFGAAETLYHITGTLPQPYELELGERTEGAMRAQLGPERYMTASGVGRRLSFAQALEEALTTVDLIEAGLASDASTWGDGVPVAEAQVTDDPGRPTMRGPGADPGPRLTHAHRRKNVPF
jgi:hypothetical protein